MPSAFLHTSPFGELYLGAKSSDSFDKFLLLYVQHKQFFSIYLESSKKSFKKHRGAFAPVKWD